MATAKDLDVKALELLIIRDGEKTAQIETLVRLVSDLSKRIDSLEQSVSGLEVLCSQSATQIQALKAKQELLTLDSGADHHLATDRDAVVRDWRHEAEAGFNTDMIPYAEQEIMSGMEALQVRRHGR